MVQHEELLWSYEDGSGSYFSMQVANMRQRLVLQAGEQCSQVSRQGGCSSIACLLLLLPGYCHER